MFLDFLRRILGYSPIDVLYLVYNEERHVGSFMQAIFRTPEEAILYIAERQDGQRRQFQQEMMEFGDEWGEFNFSPEPLILSISTYNIQTHEIRAYSGPH